MRAILNHFDEVQWLTEGFKGLVWPDSQLAQSSGTHRQLAQASNCSQNNTALTMHGMQPDLHRCAR